MITFKLLKPAAKSLLAFAIAFVGGLAAGAVDDNALSLAEWLASASAGLVSLGVVWRVPNVPADKHRGNR